MPIKDVFSEIYAEFEGGFGAARGDELRCRLANWWDGRVMGELSKEIFGDDEGSHATASEVALTQYALPDTIKEATLEPPRAPSGETFGLAHCSITE